MSFISEERAGYWGKRRQTPATPVQRRSILEEVTGQRKYPLDVAKQFFGRESSAVKAQRLRTEDPVAYAEMHKDAEFYGLVDPPAYFDPSRDAFSPERRTYTPEELQLRQEFSEQEIRDLYRGINTTATHNLAAIQKSDPAKYQRIRAAAVSYGVVDPESVVIVKHRQAKPQTQNDNEPFVLSEEHCRQFNVPRGTRMTFDEFTAAVNVYTSHQEQMRNAAIEAAASENQNK